MNPKGLFTQDEITILRANPYTLSVSEHSIRFTKAFKEVFWLKRQAGDRLQNIVTDLGYDVEILGMQRIKTISTRIRTEALSIEGFHENNSPRKIHPDQEVFDVLPKDEAMVRMQHEILYLRQELDFIKKIIKTETSGDQKQ